MDKAIELKLKDFKQALTSLSSSIEKKEDEFMRDSVIKRFEYCFELAWKSAKIFLKQQHGVEVFSPKECFRELRRNKLINDSDTEELLQMVNDRNDIIHN